MVPFARPPPPTLNTQLSNVTRCPVFGLSDATNSEGSVRACAYAQARTEPSLFAYMRCTVFTRVEPVWGLFDIDTVKVF